jgi:DNA replication and repair protein RecF
VRLRWLEVQDFRNHERTSLEVPPGVVALVGANAQGKTNLLEAAIYLLTLRTPRAASDEPLVRKGAESAFLRGEVETTAGTVLLEVEVRATGANRIRVNHAPVRRRRDVRREVRGVMFLPEDAAVVQGEPEERRRFMDEAVEGLWPAEETARRAYERALRQRNRLLKEHEPPAPPPDLEAWDAELVRHGTRVTHTRGEMVSRLGPRASEEYEAVAGDRLHVRYAPSVEGEDLERAFLDRLRARRDDELVRRRTLVGPHRDELELGVGDLSARRFASHGETWAAALCLRFGLAGAVEEETREPPVLLLDDPFSGLDPVRRQRVGGRLEGRGQVVVAVPDEAHVPAGAAVFEVAEGRVRPR